MTLSGSTSFSDLLQDMNNKAYARHDGHHKKADILVPVKKDVMALVHEGSKDYAQKYPKYYKKEDSEEISKRVMYSLSHLSLNPQRRAGLLEYPPSEDPVSGALNAAQIPVGKRKSKDHSGVKDIVQDWDALRSERLVKSTIEENNDGKEFVFSEETHLFTVTPEGKILFLRDEDDAYMHTQIDNERPSALAGEMTFGENSLFPREITQKSGHYRHSSEQFRKICKRLYKDGVLGESTILVDHHLDNQGKKKDQRLGNASHLFKDVIKH